MKKKDFDSKTYNFSDCREITGDELYQINTFMNQTNSSSLLFKNMNLDTLFKAACNQGLAYYFEANY